MSILPDDTGNQAGVDGGEPEMTKNEALAVAKMNHTARTQAEIEHLFHGGPEADGSKFSYRHGWYSVGSHSFSTEDVTGMSYDITQGGWAYL